MSQGKSVVLSQEMAQTIAAIIRKGYVWKAGGDGNSSHCIECQRHWKPGAPHVHAGRCKVGELLDVLDGTECVFSVKEALADGRLVIAPSGTIGPNGELQVTSFDLCSNGK